MTQILPMDSDVLVIWEEPVDKSDNTFIGSDATGLVTLKDSDGNAVTNAENLSATYQAGPPRRYVATIPNDITLTEGATYYIEYTLTASGGTPHGFRRWAVIAGYVQ